MRKKYYSCEHVHLKKLNLYEKCTYMRQIHENKCGGKMGKINESYQKLNCINVTVQIMCKTLMQK